LTISANEFWTTQLDDAAARNSDRASSHVFAEGLHSDVRGQIYTLTASDEFSLPHEQWPRHLFIVIGITGSIEARLEARTIVLRPFSQLVVLPGVPCHLKAAPEGAVELISLLSITPVAQVAG
jgi:hypothetical protein